MRVITASVILLVWFMLPTLNAGAYQYEDDRGKFSLAGYLEGRAIDALDRDTPKENPSGELGLELKASASSWLSSKLFLKAVDDGKVIDPGNGMLVNDFVHIYQDKNPFLDFNEAYVDIYTGKVDLRLGIQKFAWGRLDEINPTDNLNTEDLTEGGTNDEVDRKIGVPAMKVNLYSDLCNVEVGWVPRYVPYRLPTSEERWFPKVLKPPPVINTGTAVGDIPVTTVYHDIDLPAFTFENSEGGIRLSKYIEGWDVSVSYFSGYDAIPLYAAPTDLIVELKDPLALDYEIRTEITMEPRIHRMHVYGFDFTTTVSDFTLRGEYAYFDNKYYNRKLDSVLGEVMTPERQKEILADFLQEYLDSGGKKKVQTFHIDTQVELQMDSMKYGFGLDYIYGDTSVSAQFIQEFIPDYDTSKPVYFNKDGYDTLLTFLFKQFFLQNTMEFNFSTAYDINFQDYLIKPSLKYSFTNDLQGTIGVMIINGKYDDSLLGQFRDNDEIFASLRCSF